VADILGVALQVELADDEDEDTTQRTSLATMKGTLVSRSTLKFAGSDLELIEATGQGKLKVKLVNPEPTGLMSRHYNPSNKLSEKFSRGNTQTITAMPMPVSVDLEPFESSLLKRRMTRNQNGSAAPEDLVIRF
jgi:hypothetical protein